jgi:uncharacterized protein (TIGR02145 family)
MKKVFAIIGFSFFSVISLAQNVGIGTNTPNASALLEVSSTSKGFLSPRMTAAQRTAIFSPVNGLLVYQTDYPVGFYFFKEGVWTRLSEANSYPNGTATPVVTICCQSWMTKNLDVDKYRNGDLIPKVTDATAWAALTTGAYCYYNNDSTTYAATYGKLYNWYAVNDPRGLAPEGWHVPTNFEWRTLENCLGGSNVAGGDLKEIGTTHWQTPNSGASNSSGFSGLPGGYRNENGTFLAIKKDGNWWISIEADPTDAEAVNLSYQDAGVSKGLQIKRRGFSVRCIRN